MIKKISDKYMKIHSRHVVQVHVLDPDMLCCQNLELTMNAKIGGINMRIA